MSQYKIIKDGETHEFETKAEWEDMKTLLDGNGVDYEAKGPSSNGSDATGTNTPEGANNAESGTQSLREDPIGYLRSINPDFVNTVKGTPAISKQGFRYLQSELNIQTESEVVGTFDDPTGVMVWAKASLPDGRSAEAHGEGYSEGDKPDPNEFVRYADTRAKNRAISDLTCAGALAESELLGADE